MSATYARVTPSLPCGNPNASRTDERPVQLTRTDGHVDNPDVNTIKMPNKGSRVTARLILIE